MKVVLQQVIFAKKTMFKKCVVLLTGLLAAALIVTAQPSGGKPAKKTIAPAKPKLVVGIVVDQMRWDYLYRFNSLYSTGGFKRMLTQGFSCENTLVPYVPTYTAPGHTCIYTGSVPAIHGIVGNNWYDKSMEASVYCTDDGTVETVGSNSVAGKMSPRNMWTTTITDELRLASNFKSKVIGISLKDRGAILPAGHSANAAYWYDNGKWITSTWYMNQLPAWVAKVNAQNQPSAYMSKDWSTLLPLEKYDMSSPDDEPFEKAIAGEKTVTFPHHTSQITADKYEAFKYTPYAATYTFNFAKAAIENEKLGGGNATDFLAVSISSTDYIGHSFGPNSIEAEDAFLRLDKDLADFLTYLDNNLGKGNYLTFLTADHGVAHVPAFLAGHQIPGGTFNDADILKELNQAVSNKYDIKKAVVAVMNYQVYLNLPEIKKQDKDSKDITRLIIKTLKQKPYIINAVETEEIAASALPEPQKKMAINGYNPRRSGDILFTFKPGYFDGTAQGTTHGLWNPYDAHIPLLFYGWHIAAGKTNQETYMTDIAATVAALLQIQMPSGCVGKPITQVMQER